MGLRGLGVRQHDAVLLEQRLVDGQGPEAAREHVGRHVREHQREHQPVAAGHLEDDQHRGDGRADDPGEHRAHAHQREGAELALFVAEERDVEEAHRAAEHRADEERRREDAARTAARVREHGRDELGDAEHEQQLQRELARERAAERLVAAAGDAGGAQQLHRRHREHAGDEAADAGVRPLRQRGEVAEGAAQLEQAVGEGHRDEPARDAEQRVDEQRGGMVEPVGLRHFDDRVHAEHLRSMTAASAAATTTPESTAWSSEPTISSMVKVTAAMGALKAAAMPAATPTGSRRRALFAGRPVARASRLVAPAQICTVGPSRPSEAPEPICRLARKNFPKASRKRTRPPSSAKAAFTCGMPEPRAPGTAQVSTAPATRPPRVGVRHRPGHPRVALGLERAIDEQRGGQLDAQVKRHRHQPAHHPHEDGDGEEVLRFRREEAAQPDSHPRAHPRRLGAQPLHEPF